jgi:hypothetical protein
MTPDEALAALRELRDCGDTEAAHIDADKVLLKLLRHLGHGKIADAFDKVPRWYS